MIKKRRQNIEEGITQMFVRHMRQFYPDILSYHIRNESAQAHHEDAGIVKGVPDFHIPYARNGFHSLYIEFKKPAVRNYKNGGCSNEQVEISDILREAGHRVDVCYSWEEAVDMVKGYFSIAATEKI